MSLVSSNDFERMTRFTVLTLRAQPTISRADLIVALMAFGGYVGRDLQVLEALTIALGYVPVDGNHGAQRAFWLATTPAQERNIRAQLVTEFGTSVVGQLAVLSDQRALVLAERNAVRNVIQNILLPFTQAPPGGTDTEVVRAVRDRIAQRLGERDGLTFVLNQIDIRIAELSR